MTPCAQTYLWIPIIALAHLQLSTSFFTGVSSLSWSNKEHTTAIGFMAGHLVSTVAEKRTVRSSSRYGEWVSIRPWRTSRGRKMPLINFSMWWKVWNLASIIPDSQAQWRRQKPFIWDNRLPFIFVSGNQQFAQRLNLSPRSQFINPHTVGERKWYRIGPSLHQLTFSDPGKADSHSLHTRHCPAGMEVQTAATKKSRTSIPLLMSSGSTLHFSPDFRVAMMAQTVELIKSGSRRKERASVRCKKPPRTVTKSQHWHHRDKPAPTSDFPPTDSPCSSRAQLFKHTNIHCGLPFMATTTLDISPVCYRDMWLRKSSMTTNPFPCPSSWLDSCSQGMADDKQLYKSSCDLVPEAFLHAHLPKLQLTQNSWPEKF